MERVNAHEDKGEHEVVDQATYVVTDCYALVQLDFISAGLHSLYAL